MICCLYFPSPESWEFPKPSALCRLGAISLSKVWSVLPCQLHLQDPACFWGVAQWLLSENNKDLLTTQQGGAVKTRDNHL